MGAVCGLRAGHELPASMKGFPRRGSDPKEQLTRSLGRLAPQ